MSWLYGERLDGEVRVEGGLTAEVAGGSALAIIAMAVSVEGLNDSLRTDGTPGSLVDAGGSRMVKLRESCFLPLSCRIRLLFEVAAFLNLLERFLL